MIRSNLPLPFLYRLRLTAGSAAKRALASPSSSYRGGREASGRSINARHAAARRPTAEGGVARLWQDFTDQYECFTGVLCSAAKSGCDPHRESEYAQLRRWFVANYYRLAARLRPALDAEFAGDGEPTPTIADYAGHRRSLDALEALFLPASLQEVLAHDTGDLIPRIARISDVVYRCYEEWEAAQPE